MGCTSDTKESTSESTSTQKTTFAKASPAEEALRKQFGDLGTEQQQAIRNLLQMGSGGSSLFGLNANDQASLTQAYDAQRQRFSLGLKDFADYSSGGRGLRMSDTPISQQSMERAGLGYADLASAQANQGLNMGLMGNQFRANNLLAGAQAMPAGSLQAYAPLYNERMAGGVTTQTGSSRIMNTNTPSIMSSIGQGIGIAGQLGAMGASFMAPGLGGLGAGAGGAGAASKASGLEGLMQFSDRRLKSNIQQIGVHRLGIGLYAYIIFGRAAIGVMADEVKQVRPWAVLQHESGYEMVDYSAI